MLIEIFCERLIVSNVTFVSQPWLPTYSASPFQNLWIRPCKYTRFYNCVKFFLTKMKKQEAVMVLSRKLLRFFINVPLISLMSQVTRQDIARHVKSMWQVCDKTRHSKTCEKYVQLMKKVCSCFWKLKLKLAIFNELAVSIMKKYLKKSFYFFPVKMIKQHC